MLSIRMTDTRPIPLYFTRIRILFIIHYLLSTAELKLMCLGVGVICAPQKRWLPFVIIAQMMGTDIKLIHTTRKQRGFEIEFCR